jgi:hypothetical protein
MTSLTSKNIHRRQSKIRNNEVTVVDFQAKEQKIFRDAETVARYTEHRFPETTKNRRD